MLHGRYDLTPHGAIRTKPVGDNTLRQTSLLLHQADQQAWQPWYCGWSERSRRERSRPDRRHARASACGHRWSRPPRSDAKCRPGSAACAASDWHSPGRISSPNTGSSHRKRRCRAPIAFPLTSAGSAEIGNTARPHGRSKTAGTMALVADCGLDHDRRLPPKPFVPVNLISSPCEVVGHGTIRDARGRSTPFPTNPSIGLNVFLSSCAAPRGRGFPGSGQAHRQAFSWSAGSRPYRGSS